jgi:hypothetical protein
MSNAEPWKKLVVSSPSVARHTLSKRRSTKLFLRSYFITAAASLEPHAALAWAGVSVLLPVSLVNNYAILTLSTKRAI